MKQVYIIDYIRTPIAKFQGGLSEVRADDLAAIVLKEIVKRNPQIPAEEIEDVILGCANQAGEDNRNVARMALLLAGLPYTVPGETVNRLCSSGMSAVIHANRAIKAGDGEVFIAGQECTKLDDQARTRIRRIGVGFGGLGVAAPAGSGQCTRGYPHTHGVSQSRGVDRPLRAHLDGVGTGGQPRVEVTRPLAQLSKVGRGGGFSSLTVQIC